jgi:hypothetical protein
LRGGWAGAVAARLAFWGQDVPAEAPALLPFLHACLDQLEQAAARPDLAPAGLPGLCALARAAINGDADDRPVNAAAAALRGLPGPAGWAAAVPGRVVFLAAMVAQLPEEQEGAAAMLVNDMAAVDAAMPRRAWQAALSR